MKKALKITCLVIAGLTAWGVMAYGGLHAFGRLIYNQRTCNWANIDNIELHARLDIPQIKSCDCTYDAALNSKYARFTIDKGKVDLDQYIRVNGFKKLANNIVPDNLLQKEPAIARIIDTSTEVYYTEGTQGAKSWQALLDKSSGSLWVMIRYAD